MPAQPVSVNLLDQPEFESTSVSRLFNWAVTYGRYIMIGTEVIVLLAFISRFSLDRKLTDLREEISQKKIILEANQGFEEEMKQLQSTIKEVNTLVDNQPTPLNVFYETTQLLPGDVSIVSYKQERASIEVKLTATSTNGFSLFLNRFQNMESLTNIEVNEIRRDPLRGTEFNVLATIK